MYRLRSSFGKKRHNAERLPVHACMLLLFSVVCFLSFCILPAANLAFAQGIRKDLDPVEGLKSKWEEIKQKGLAAGDVKWLTDQLQELGGDKIEDTGVGELLDSMNKNAERLANLKDAGDKLSKAIDLVEKFKNLETGDKFDAKATLEALSDTIAYMSDLMSDVPPPFGTIAGPMLKAYAEAIKNSASHAAAIQAATEAKNKAIAAARGEDTVTEEPEDPDDSFEWNVYPYPYCPECELYWWMAGNAEATAGALEGAYESAKGEADALSEQAKETRDGLVKEGYRESTAERMANEQKVLFEGQEMELIDAYNRLLPEVQRLKEKFENASEHAKKMRQLFLDCLEECNKKARKDYGLLTPGYDIGPGEPISYALGSLANLDAVRIGNESPKWCHTSAGTPGHVPIDGFSPRDISEPGTVTPPGETAIRPGDVTPEMLRKLELSLPPSQPMDPSDELEYLQRLATLLTFLMIDPDLKDDERRRVEQILLDTKMEILGLQAGLQDEAGEDPRDTAEPESSAPPEEISVPTITIYVKAQTSVLVGEQDMTLANVGQQVKLFGASVLDPALPADGADKPQTGHDQGPVQGTTDDKGSLALKVPMTALGIDSPGVQPLSDIGGPAFQVTIDTTPQSSVNVKVGGVDPKAAVGSVPDSARSFLVDVNKINGSVFLTFMFPSSMEGPMNKILVSIPGVVNIEINYCRTKEVTLDDPHFNGIGGWGQSYNDQWAIKRVGLTDDPDSAWNKMGTNPHPVIVAVIDSGLDWNHLDFDWRNLWQNPSEIPNNGIDDDNNGYIDDMIGWDFFANNNKPWDHDGHGTIVSGIIAAAQNNGIGISGINPHARIMVCKALNNFGNTRASYLAKAIVYAVDNGARVINMSVGGKNLTQIEQEAVAYAVAKGVLIVVASGNEGVNVDGFGLAGLDGVMTVAATGLDDKRSVFSNWGGQVDIAAPGIEVLGLRARLTDTMRDIPGVEYVDGANFVGEDNRYYRGSGTSFATPIVTGIASLVISKKPEFTGPQVARILKQSARDIDVPGVDQFSGFGLVDASAALDASPEFFIHSSIQRVEVAQGEKGPVVQVFGTADADLFQKAMIAIGAGDDPSSWKDVVEVNKIVKEGLLGSIPAQNFVGAKVWMIRLTTEHRSGVKREFRFRLSVG